MYKKFVPLVLLAAILLSAVYVLAARPQIEAGNRTITFAMDGPDIAEHAATLGIEPIEYLTALRDAGLFAVLVPYEDLELRHSVAEAGLSIVLLLHGEPLPAVSAAYDTSDAVGVCFPDADTSVEFVNFADLTGKLVFLLGRSDTFRGYIPSPAQTEMIARGHPTVRTFRISRRETDAAHITPKSMTYRWQMSIREFNTKALFARPFYDIGMDENAEYVQAVVSALADDGYAVGLSEPIAPFYPGKPVVALITLGVGGLVVLFAAMLGLPSTILLMGSVATCLLAVLTFIPALSLHVRLGVALAGAVAASSMGIIWAAGKGGSRRRWWLTYGVANLMTLCGALLTAALLSDTDFLVELHVFRGVKLQYILPILLVALYGAVRIVGRKGIREIREWPLWVKLGIAGAGLAVIAVYFLRIDTSLGSVSQLELAVREAVDRLLIVRPRFKELVGHPLLLLSLYYRRKLPRALFALGLVGATIGQISVVNTFMHLRTPLIMSLIRTAHGLWIGTLIGLLALAVVCWAEARLHKH